MSKFGQCRRKTDLHTSVPSPAISYIQYFNSKHILPLHQRHPYPVIGIHAWMTPPAVPPHLPSSVLIPTQLQVIRQQKRPRRQLQLLKITDTPPFPENRHIHPHKLIIPRFRQPFHRPAPGLIQPCRPHRFPQKRHRRHPHLLRPLTLRKNLLPPLSPSSNHRLSSKLIHNSITKNTFSSFQTTILYYNHIISSCFTIINIIILTIKIITQCLK